MIIFIVVRAGQKGANLPDADFVGAPVGLLSARAGVPFDPDFAILSPIEMTEAPLVFLIDEVTAGLNQEAKALADGRVMLVAGEKVILAHAQAASVFETVYSGLASVRVRVGALVARGEALGQFRSSDSGDSPIRIEIRGFPGLSISNAAPYREAPTLPSPIGAIHAAPRARPSEASAMKVEIPGTKP